MSTTTYGRTRLPPQGNKVTVLADVVERTDSLDQAKLLEEKRIAEENQKRLEIEKKRIEEERTAEIKAQKLATEILKAKTDSLTNEEMKKKIVQTVENIKKQVL